MKVQITGIGEAQFRIMGVYAIFGEFKPSEPVWYSDKIGQVLEVESLRDGRYTSRAYGSGICAGDAKVVPEDTRLSPVDSEQVRALAAARKKAEEQDRFFQDYLRRADKVFSKP